jgi:hypothetical protein
MRFLSMYFNLNLDFVTTRVFYNEYKAEQRDHWDFLISNGYKKLALSFELNLI